MGWNKSFRSSLLQARFAQVQNTITSRGLIVDGFVGPATVRAIRLWLSTHSNTNESIFTRRPVMQESCIYESMAGGLAGQPLATGLVQKLQQRLGRRADGKMGPKTIIALQRMLNKELGGSDLAHDGLFGPKTRSALQVFLNSEIATLNRMSGKSESS